MAVFNESTQDLKNDVLFKCGELVDGTSTFDSNGTVLKYLNKANVKVLEAGNEFIPDLSKPWPWAIVTNPFTFVLQQPIIDGSISATQGNTTITFSIPPTISVAGWWIRIQNRPEWFKILAHTASAATATIDTPYSDTSGSGFFYNCVLLDYMLTPTDGIIRMVSPMIVYRPQGLEGDQEGKIYLMDEGAMLKEYPLIRIEQGTPTFFCVTGKTEDGKVSIRFNRYIQDLTKVEARYIKSPDALTDSSSNYPLIPRSFRDVLVYIASYWLCIDKNDDRAEKYLALAQATGKAMINASEKEKIQTSKTRGKLIPRQDAYYRGRKYVVQEVT